MWLSFDCNYVSDLNHECNETNSLINLVKSDLATFILNEIPDLLPCLNALNQNQNQYKYKAVLD